MERSEAQRALITPEKQLEYRRRIAFARMRLLQKHGFYGLLLMHLQFALDEQLETAATDGVRIFFGPAFLDTISDSELEFVLLHEVLHVVLRHMSRAKHFDHFLFNIASDIVVNSNILLANNGDLATITLGAYGESMHKAPNGEEGHRYTAEEVYRMLAQENKPEKYGAQAAQQEGDDKTGTGAQSKSGNSDKKDTKEDKKGERQGAGARAAARREAAAARAAGKDKTSGSAGEDGNRTCAHWDDHAIWQRAGDSALADVWQQRAVNAAEVVSMRDPNNVHGTLPKFAARLVEELKHPQTDWRQVLAEFIQEDVCDYSFSPPDRRFSDSDIFLPDFCEREEYLRDILFFIDTSASMSEAMLTAAFSELKGAMEQFRGRLAGKLGFFDAAVIPPEPFEDITELLGIKAQGGGGTSFHVIFDYVREMDEPPVCIIILTDGYAPMPDETEAAGIPVLWLINNKEVTPSFGRVARIDMEAYDF